MNIHVDDFIRQLSSKAPVPGGGGASALIGAVGVSLCSMVANLTSGKEKYAEYQKDIEAVIRRAKASTDRLINLIAKDAEVFAPLSAAYGIPKDDPQRAAKLEKALLAASAVPLEILTEVSNVLDIIEELTVKGTRIAISDVGVAASACRSAMESAALNVFINTKLMKDRKYAAKMNEKTWKVLIDGIERCNAVYLKIADELR